MDLLRDLLEFENLLQQSKQPGKTYVTNLFASRSIISGWISRAELMGTLIRGNAFLFRKEGNFHRFYFAAPSLSDLESNLHLLPGLRDHAVVIDLVGETENLVEMSTTFKRIGFRKLGSLLRMARTKPAPAGLPYGTSPGIRWARPGDGKEILQLLQSHFDPITKQLPLPFEVEKAIEAEQIFIAQVDGRPAGFLWFETQGRSSLLRFWLVDRPFQNQLLGSALMQRYFECSPQVRRFVLWVLDSNIEAIDRYVHYGFESERLRDIILGNDHIPT
jgi:ribosomal protein S18 acetylase RimI-like enzyme